jgi:hypothetical protein
MVGASSVTSVRLPFVTEDNMSVSRFLIALSLAWPLVSPVGAQDVTPTPSEETPRYTLRYRFEQGESLYYRLSEKMSLLQQFEGGKQLSENDSSIEKHYRVMETRGDGSAVLEVVTDRVQIKYIFADAEPVEYDSNSGETPPEPLKGLRGKFGKPVAKAEFTARGELLSLVEIAQGSQSVEPEDLGRKNFLIPLPSEPIAVGETWKHGYQINLQQSKPPYKQPFQVTEVYQLKKVEREQAEISFVTLISPRLIAPELRAQMIQELPRGTIVFDLREGRIVSQTRRVDRTELGIAGPKTAMSVNSLKVEKLIDREQAVSRKSP